MTFLSTVALSLLLSNAAFGAINRRTPEMLQEAIKHKADTHWEEFKMAYGKSYYSAEHEQQHREAFEKLKSEIKMHNAAFERGEVGYKMGISEISDMTDEEFQLLNGFRPGKQQQTRKNNDRHVLKEKNLKLESTGGFALGLKEQPRIDASRLPRAVDWRRGNGSYYLVTSVKNQKHCGSCWAFSTVGVLEAAHARATGNLMDLSPQNLVDCDETNSGCNGGYPMMALAYAIDEGGLNAEVAYPYVGVDAKCRFNKFRPLGGMEARQIVNLPVGDEHALMAAVATQGPISVALEVTYNFKNYAGGILDDRTCGNRLLELNHAVLLVGYGTDPRWGDYWIVKNSWGTSWGDEGYIRMSRNKGNQCGIATQAVYVQI